MLVDAIAGRHHLIAMRMGVVLIAGPLHLWVKRGTVDDHGFPGARRHRDDERGIAGASSARNGLGFMLAVR
jgi:hypothetical protein